MSDGFGEQAWSHTSNLMALIANCNRDPKKTSPIKPSRFNPYEGEQEKPIVIGKSNIHLLREAFEGK